MLRVDKLGFLRQYAKERGVEHVGIVEHGSRGDEIMLPLCRRCLAPNSEGVNRDTLSTPSRMLRQNSPTLRTPPGNRPAMPMIATPSSVRRKCLRSFARPSLLFPPCEHFALTVGLFAGLGKNRIDRHIAAESTGLRPHGRIFEHLHQS